MTAGQSAADMAAQVRREGRGGLLRRALRALGFTVAQDARTAAQAAYWEAGAVGERLTAETLQPLAQEGWKGFYDRAIPGARSANADHVLIEPAGTFAVLVDSKLWSARYPVGAVGGRLMHGRQDRDHCIRSVQFEADLVAKALGVRVAPIIAVHNAPVLGNGFEVRGVLVVPAARLVPVLQSGAGRRSPRAEALAAKAATVLPRYVR